MLDITLQSIPNQSFSINADGYTYDVTIKDIGTYMIADISIDGAIIISGARCMPFRFLIPYPYLAKGNFVFITDNEEYPRWENFNISQRLQYLSPDEMKNYAY